MSASSRWEQLITLPGQSFIFTAVHALALGCLLTAWLIVAALRATQVESYQQAGSDLVIRAVLKPEATEERARELAAALQEDRPSLRISVIGESAGRSLLALQEPWLAQMPDVQVAPLPILLEISDKFLMRTSTRAGELVTDIEDIDEVDFVAFNTTAHSRLQTASRQALTLAGRSVKWATALLAMAALLLHGLVIYRTARFSTVGAAVHTLIALAGAGVLATVLYKLWRISAPLGTAHLPLRHLAGAIVVTLILLVGTAVAAAALRRRFP